MTHLAAEHEPPDPAPEADTASALAVALRWLVEVLSEPDETSTGRTLDVPELLGRDDRLAEIATRFELSPTELTVLIVALSPHVDAEFTALLVGGTPITSGPPPDVATCVRLAGASLGDPSVRRVFDRSAPLRLHRLLGVGDGHQPLPARPVTVPERVVRFLLGDDGPADDLVEALVPQVAVDHPEVRTVGRALRAGVPLIHLHERPRAAGRAVAASAVTAVERRSIVVSIDRVTGEAVDRLLELAILEATLTGRVLVIGPWSLEHHGPDVLDTLMAAPCPVIVHGSDPLPSSVASTHRFTLEVGPPSWRARVDVWRSVLETLALDVEGDLDRLGTVPLAPERAVQAALLAEASAVSDQRPTSVDDIINACRTQADRALDRHVTGVDPTVRLEDLVLPANARAELTRMLDRVRYQDVVRDTWGLRNVAGRARGVTALFSGPSGTGKSLSAEALAGELGVELHIVDLAAIVDKYVGETEKNLEQVFAAGEAEGGVLFFDEADALFGKRSEVRGANDRFANAEVAYLLQRFERYDGIVVLATNLRANIDDAFARRLDVVVSFDLPDEAARLALWRRHLPDHVPLSDDVDLELLAAAAALTGGLIRNTCLDAAFCAAGSGGTVTMEQLVRSTARTLQMTGRLLDPEAFGRWAAVLDHPSR